MHVRPPLPCNAPALAVAGLASSLTPAQTDSKAAPMRLSVSLPIPRTRRRSSACSGCPLSYPSVPSQALVVVILPHAAYQSPHLPHCCLSPLSRTHAFPCTDSKTSVPRLFLACLRCLWLDMIFLVQIL